MAFTSQRRHSSWFGPQFSLQSFSLSTLGVDQSSRPTSAHRKSPKEQPAQRKQPTVQRLATAEPLFVDSYLSDEEELSPTQPEIPRWHTSYDNGDLVPDETLEELGFALDDDDCSIVATYVSIVNVGKPKVIDISPPGSIREHPSPRFSRPAVRSEDGTTIFWRAPSYHSSSRSSSVYSRSDRTESFDAESSSSFSESPQTPDYDASWPLGLPGIPELTSTPKYTLPERARTLRRQSKNLSVSLSKAFLNRLKDVTPEPPVPSHGLIVDSPSRLSLPRNVAKRATTLDLPSYQAEMTKSTPVLRRKKSLGEMWLQR